MKKTATIFIITFALFLNACETGSTQTKKVEKEIGKIETNKTSVNSCKFFINDKEIADTKVPYGSIMIVKVKGFDGFKEVKGKINSTVSLQLTDKNGDFFLNEPDLFSENYPDGIATESFKNNLYFSVKFQPKAKINETYHLVLTVADKNSDAKVTITEDFLLVPSKGLSYTEKGLTSYGAFLLLNNSNDYNNIYLGNTLKGKDTLTMIIPGIKGLKEKDNTVWLGLSVSLYNEMGDRIENKQNVFSKFEKTGMEANKVKNLLDPYYVIPDYLKPDTKYKVTLAVYDLKEEASIELNYNFTFKK